MSSEEGLGTGDDVTNHDGGSEGVYEMLVVGMQNQSVEDFT